MNITVTVKGALERRLKAYLKEIEVPESAMGVVLLEEIEAMTDPWQGSVTVEGYTYPNRETANRVAMRFMRGYSGSEGMTLHYHKGRRVIAEWFANPDHVPAVVRVPHPKRPAALTR